MVLPAESAVDKAVGTPGKAPPTADAEVTAPPIADASRNAAANVDVPVTAVPDACAMAATVSNDEDGKAIEAEVLEIPGDLSVSDPSTSEVLAPCPKPDTGPDAKPGVLQVVESAGEKEVITMPPDRDESFLQAVQQADVHQDQKLPQTENAAGTSCVSTCSDGDGL
jgi:hypothetical protein